MPFFRSQQARTEGIPLGNISKEMDPQELISALPGITHHLASLAQKAAILLYRKIHSHETGCFLAVRDEFLFLFCQAFRQKAESSLPPDDAAKAWHAYQESLNFTLAQLQRGFDVPAFWQTEANRAERYGRCRLVQDSGQITLSETAVASLFADYQTLHLGQELGQKLRHFSEQVLRDLQGRL
ncbi:MAG: hypothetical protein ACM3ON_00210 [Chloroflexota bacterium]